MADRPTVSEQPAAAATEAEIRLQPATPPTVTEAEDREMRLDPNWRKRRFLITTAAYVGLWLLLSALLQTETPKVVYAVLLTPFYVITLLIALRTPKKFRRPKATRNRLSFTNRLSLAILIFVGVYLPFTFVSNKVIPHAPTFEFFLFLGILFLLYWLVGRSVGVAGSQEALPPATHRLHKQVVLPIDDPHYQRTLFLNFEFVDRGKGAKSLAKRLDSAMESVGVGPERRHAIVEDLSDYHEGFGLNFAFTRGGRERRRRGRERRSQVLRTVYTKFNQELEQGA